MDWYHIYKITHKQLCEAYKTISVMHKLIAVLFIAVFILFVTTLYYLNRGHQPPTDRVTEQCETSTVLEQTKETVK